MDNPLTSRLRPVLDAMPLVRDAPAQLRTSAKVALKASNSELASALPVEDVSLVRSKWTLPIPSASRTMVPDAKSARTVLTPTATDALTLIPDPVRCARKVTPEVTLVLVSSAPPDVSSAEMPTPV